MKVYEKISVKGKENRPGKRMLFGMMRMEGGGCRAIDQIWHIFCLIWGLMVGKAYNIDWIRTVLNFKSFRKT